MAGKPNSREFSSQYVHTPPHLPGRMIKGDYDSTYGYGGGESNGHFENDLCVFNKQF